MNNFWFNIRFGTRHWQWGPDGMSFNHNLHQIERKYTEPDTWKWFEIYTIFGRSL